MLAEKFLNPEVAVIGGGIDFVPVNYWSLADNLNMFYEYLKIHPEGVRSQLPSLNMAIRREVFNTVGGFDERYPRPSGEDADLTLRLRKNGYRLYFEPTVVVSHKPLRNTFKQLLRHSYFQGMYSTKVDRRYPDEGLAHWLRSPIALIILAPVIAFGGTWRMFYRYPDIRLYWFTIPAIYSAKIAWCLGAAKNPFR